MGLDPGKVVAAERRSGDDPEAVLGEARDREVALDPAALVQHRRVRDRTDVARDLVVTEPLEELGGSRAGHLDLREGRLVEDRGRLARRAVLRADRGRPEAARPAARTERLVSRGGVRLEPVRALPAGLLAEGCAELCEPRVGGGEAERPPGLALVAGVLDVVVRRVDLDGARKRVVAASVVAPEAARVHLPDVEARYALDDPLGHELAHAAGAGEPVRAEARGDPEAAHVGRAEDELAVGGERLGAVDQPEHLGVLQHRHPDDRVLHQLLEAVPVLVEQPAVEVRRDAVETPRRRVAARSRP